MAVAAVLAAGCAQAEARNPCATAKSSAVLVEKGEPGVPLRVRGRVYRPDGTTPAAGVILYVYQTDAKGLYVPADAPSKSPRIKGWMLTDSEGRFEFLTIRPGPYPNRSEPAHIHTQLWGVGGKGAPPHSNVTLLFADDPLVRPGERSESDSLGQFGFVKSPGPGKDDVLEATLDIRLQESGDTFEDSILHGVAPCGVKPPVRD
jgi:protocatechuate 3,4-dioxygenase beta subunit